MKVKVLVSGRFRDITSSNGKNHRFSEVWVYLPNAPFPVQVDHYGDIKADPGDYEVPLLVDVRDRRMSVRLDFTKAVPVKQGA